MLFMSCVCHAFASVHCCLVVWSPAGKELTAWLLFVMFNCVLSLSHVVSWVRCGTCLYRFLIFAAFLTLSQTNKLFSINAYSSSTYENSGVVSYNAYSCVLISSIHVLVDG